MRAIWSPTAESELDAIWLYIAADNPDAADRIIESLHAALKMLSEHPKIGRQGRSHQTRELVVAGTPYILIYRTREDIVEIAHVIHHAQDWPPRRKR